MKMDIFELGGGPGENATGKPIYWNLFLILGLRLNLIFGEHDQISVIQRFYIKQALFRVNIYFFSLEKLIIFNINNHWVQNLHIGLDIPVFFFKPLRLESTLEQGIDFGVVRFVSYFLLSPGIDLKKRRKDEWMHELAHTKRVSFLACWRSPSEIAKPVWKLR